MAMHGSMQLKYVLTKVQQHWDYECEEHRVCRFQGCACYGFYTIWWWHGPNFSHEPARGHPLLCWLSSSTWRWHGREAIGGVVFTAFQSLPWRSALSKSWLAMLSFLTCCWWSHHGGEQGGHRSLCGEPAWTDAPWTWIRGRDWTYQGLVNHEIYLGMLYVDVWVWTLLKWTHVYNFWTIISRKQHLTHITCMQDRN